MNQHVSLIKERLNEFKNLNEKQQYQEFQFCLLTPQSNAQRCWQAVQEITKLTKRKEKQVNKILKTKTRFHNTKTKRIMQAKETWKKISPHLNHKNSFELRNFLAKNVEGYGLKEAGHFLRNIGKSNNQIAILDRHILRNLHGLGVINDQKIKNAKQYFEIEQIFLSYAQRLGITPDELDLLWWSQENGEVFK